MDTKRVKVLITVNYVDEFVFHDIYEASTFMTTYVKGANKECKFEVAISFENEQQVKDISKKLEEGSHD